jgi:hypothetical protein
MANLLIDNFNNYLFQENGEVGRHLDHMRDKSEWNYDRKFHNGEKDFYGIGPKDYWPTDDRINEKVCETLYRDNLIDASDIEVRVEDGVVTLDGKVDSRKIKRMAEDLIFPIFGVKDVINRLSLKPDHGLVGGGVEWPI